MKTKLEELKEINLAIIARGREQRNFRDISDNKTELITTQKCHKCNGKGHTT